MSRHDRCVAAGTRGSNTRARACVCIGVRSPRNHSALRDGPPRALGRAMQSHPTTSRLAHRRLRTAHLVSALVTTWMIGCSGSGDTPSTAAASGNSGGNSNDNCSPCPPQLGNGAGAQDASLSGDTGPTTGDSSSDATTEAATDAGLQCCPDASSGDAATSDAPGDSTLGVSELPPCTDGGGKPTGACNGMYRSHCSAGDFECWCQQVECAGCSDQWECAQR